MTVLFETSNDEQIAAEACAWLAQIETGNLSAADRAAFREWVNRSPRHAAEFRSTAALSEELSVLTELLAPMAAEAAPSGRQAFRIAAVPAIALLGFIALGAMIYVQFFKPSAFHEFYATDIGAYHTIELPDGSSVKLNTNSAMEVTIDNATREVRLAKGEAFFDVAKDASRPFVVYAGANAARAVGTAFSVRLYDDKTELIVTEGTVEFSALQSDLPAPVAGDIPASAAEASAAPILVEAGYEVSSEPARMQNEAQKLNGALQRSKLSWTEGLFDFSNTPLSDVVNEVSRHTTIKIHIADPDLKDVKFGGVFRIGDVDTLLDTLPNVGVVVQWTGDNEVSLHSKQDA